MQKKLKKIQDNFRIKIEEISSLKELKSLENSFLGKKGALKKILELLKTLDKKDKQIIGKFANELRSDFKQKIRDKKKEINQSELNDEKAIDVSLPGKKLPRGHIHPLTQTIDSVKRVFESMGFSIITTPEIETEFYNFDTLNIPKHHPARDLWDTFWIDEKDIKPKDDEGHYLLRTHTTAIDRKSVV